MTVERFNDLPLVSVIIPTYNRRFMTLEALNSVLKQTYRNLEVIVVDDASTDSTPDIQNRIYDERFKYIRHPKNKGVSATRNTGIKESHGEYISFLDSDDIWFKKKLEIQMDRILQEKKEGIYYTNERWVRNGKFLNQKKKHKKTSGWLFDRFLPLCLASISTVVLHKKIIDKIGLFDENLQAAEDYDFFIRGSIIYPFYFIDRPLVTKRGGHPDQLTRKLPALDQYRIRSLYKIYFFDGLLDAKRNLVFEELSNKCRILGNGCFKRNKKEPANFFISLPGILKSKPVDNIDWQRHRI